jgi:hypothetical protein
MNEKCIQAQLRNEALATLLRVTYTLDFMSQDTIPS